jgi:hypothetical protein
MLSTFTSTLEDCGEISCNIKEFWSNVVDSEKNLMFREFISDTIAQLA